ncbi:MAG: hypothetical protein AUK47_00915 [Deltaproteobacteria bacterium CG2_30_63_29]|nr:MAG: hypothetical protein AUK47_00915 [Deltaproteobacteria bacterium CG2_30_63_29]
MKVKLTRTAGAQFRCENAAGRVSYVSGPEEVGESERGLRPMESVLMSLASCAAVDVLMILEKGRFRVDVLDVQVEGERAKDQQPAVFTRIHLHFEAAGDFAQVKLERSIELSMMKYCSVAKMLAPTVAITTSCAKVQDH